MSASYVLVFNCGSSSIKFAVIDPQSGTDNLSGLVQCINQADANMKWQTGGNKQTRELANVSYQNAIEVVIELLRNEKVLYNNIIAVGHRVVHGGETFTKSTLIDAKVIAEIKACSNLAPLHNPANLIGIEATKKIFPKLPQTAVFDTAFHQSMPEHAYLYAIPYKLYQEHAIRRYGFHGTSHLYVTKKAAEIINKPYEKCAFISAHLGNGCSVAAVLNGKSVDTSMGLTPLEGLVMGTRSGDIDPSVHAHLAKVLNKDIDAITNMLNKESGLLGISQQFPDMRGIEENALKGEPRALLAENIFCYRLAKYIASYTVPLGRIDALIFTGGIGERSPIVRKKVLHMLKIFNFTIDEQHNEQNGSQSNGFITKVDTPVALVVPTNEELVIAQDAARLAMGAE